MKKKLTIGIFFLAIICVSTCCSRKIIGATPHRRDRHCGCENLSPTRPADDDLATWQDTGEKEVPSLTTFAAE